MYDCSDGRSGSVTGGASKHHGLHTMPNRPNILFILTDQHRLEAVSSYADTVCQTPNIDRLADEGVQFDRAYTPCPVCTPARASIMTGQFPHSHGMCDNVASLGCSVHSIPDRSELLSRRLDDAGYNCGYTGKWHLAPDDSNTEIFGREVEQTVPSDVGFEGQDFPGHGDGGWQYPEYQSYLEENGFSLELDALESSPGGRASVVETPTEATVPYFLTEHTISLLERFDGTNEPFFLWHNFWGPHEPYRPSREYYEQYREQEIPPWPNADWPADDIPGTHHCRLSEEAATTTWEEWEDVVRHYYAFTSMIDAQIGRLLDCLERLELFEETVVVFAADHGETLGSHGGLEDKGFHHFEEIMHVPLIVRFPNGQWANTNREELVSLLDLYPTFLDIAGVDASSTDVHGRSLEPLLDGRVTDWRDAVGVEFHGLGGVAHTQRTVLMDDLKYGYNPGGTDELYDLSIDPHETQNLIDNREYADELAALRAQLDDWMKSTDDPLR